MSGGAESDPRPILLSVTVLSRSQRQAWLEAVALYVVDGFALVGSPFLVLPLQLPLHPLSPERSHIRRLATDE